MIVERKKRQKVRQLRSLFVLLCIALALSTVVRAVQDDDLDDDDYDFDAMMEKTRSELESKSSFK